MVINEMNKLLENIKLYEELCYSSKWIAKRVYKYLETLGW